MTCDEKTSSVVALAFGNFSVGDDITYLFESVATNEISVNISDVTCDFVYVELRHRGALFCPDRVSFSDSEFDYLLQNPKKVTFPALLIEH